MIDKLLGAILGLGAASMLSKKKCETCGKEYEKGGKVGDTVVVSTKMIGMQKVMGKIESLSPLKIRTSDNSVVVIPNSAIIEISPAYAKGGGVDYAEKESLKHFLIHEASSGMIANKLPYSDYKTIDEIRFLAIQILNRDGDRQYSIASFNEIIQEALLEYEENKFEGRFAEGGAVDGVKSGAAKRLKIKNWYTKSYPTDDLGKEINDQISFWELYTYMSQGFDFYPLVNVYDSLVRERVFQKLSEILGVEYDVIYAMWLRTSEYAKGGSTYARGGKIKDGNVVKYNGYQYIVHSVESNGKLNLHNPYKGYKMEYLIDPKDVQFESALPFEKGGSTYSNGGYSVWERNGFTEYPRTSPKEYENVEWSLNGNSPSFLGKMYFQKGTGFMFIEKENGDIFTPKSSHKLFWRKINDDSKYSKGGSTYAEGGEIKQGDFVKKKGSNIELKVVEVGNDWRSGKDFIKIYNDVTDQTKTLVDWSDYELVTTYSNGGEVYSTLSFETKKEAEQNAKEIENYFNERFVSSEVIFGTDERGKKGYQVKYELKKDRGSTYAKGGVTKHGLKKGDTLGEFEGNAVTVYPNNEDEKYKVFQVNLNKGVRMDASKYLELSQAEQDQFNKMARGGEVRDMFSKFEVNEKGNFSAFINNKKYEIVYRDDKTKLYDLFENNKKVKSSKDARSLMLFPSISAKVIFKHYERNEDLNLHSENVVLLATHFGTEDELKKAKEILRKHIEDGSLSMPNMRERQLLHDKLFKKLLLLKEKEEIEKGGKTEKYELAMNPLAKKFGGSEKKIQDWLQDTAKNSKKYKLAVLLMMGEKDPDEALGLEWQQYGNILRGLEKIHKSSVHEGSWRTENYTLNDAEKWAKKSLNEAFVLKKS